MKYLIAGCAGFLGSNLSDRLVKASRYNHVTVVDDLSTGNLVNIYHLMGLKNFKFIHNDITQRNNWFEEKFDVIFNLACPASPIHYQETPIRTTITSVLGTYNLLELANLNKARFLQASTSEVYGNPEIHPQPESYWGNVNSFGPRSCYDEGKRCAESLCYDFQKLGVDLRIVRIFNTYGPNMAVNDGRVVSNFIVQALKGDSITIYGTGEQTRSFCYVDDLLDGFLAVLGSDIKTPINLGNPVEFTMWKLAQLVITITNSKSRIVFKDLPKDDPERRRPDIKLAKSLGWCPSIQLEEGLKKTIEYFKKVI